ncbi:MAG: DUF99 family protein [Thermoplasmata archaeon]|nr:DUF99 family protein [Thermoplasmata archaeon]
MRRALAKTHLCVVGVDDGSFRRRQRYAPVAAVVLRIPDLVDSVHLDQVRVDGNDATVSIERLVRRAPAFEGVRAVLLDGIVVGGFNIVDIHRLSQRLDRPVIAVTHRAPDFARIRSALHTYFPGDFRRRWARVRAARLFRVPTGGEPILAAAAGCRRADAIALVQRCTIRGYWPEPIRLAHLVARAAGAAAPAKKRKIKPRPTVLRPGL